MATTGLDLMKELGQRAQGRSLGWSTQATYTNAPNGSASGIDVRDAIVAMVQISPRMELHNHASRIRVTTADLAATTYTITINAVAVAYDASAETPATTQALLTGIVDEINADAGAAAIVLATLEDLDGDGVLETIVLRNITGEANTHITTIAVSGGAGALAFDEDATGCAARLFLLADTEDATSLGEPLPWCLVNGSTFAGIDWRGFKERFETSGEARLYVELYDVTGPASPSPNPVITVAIAPGLVES